MANSDALILFQVQDVSTLSTDCYYLRRTPGPCYVGILSLLMRPRKHSIVRCHSSICLASSIVHERLKARPANLYRP